MFRNCKTNISQLLTKGFSPVLHCASPLYTIFIPLACAHVCAQQNQRDLTQSKLNSKINVHFYDYFAECKKDLSEQAQII